MTERKVAVILTTEVLKKLLRLPDLVKIEDTVSLNKGTIGAIQLILSIPTNHFVPEETGMLVATLDRPKNQITTTVFDSERKPIISQTWEQDIILYVPMDEEEHA